MRDTSCVLRITWKIAEKYDKTNINLLNALVSRQLRIYFRTWFYLVNLLIKNLIYAFFPHLHALVLIALFLS